MIRALSLLVGLNIVLSTVGAAAQDASTPTPSPVAVPSDAPDGDRAALTEIVEASVAEVRLCDLAVAKTQTPEVRAFCRRAVNDHARAAITGMQVARDLGDRDLKLEPAPGTSAIIDTLEGYSGHEFDRAFLLAQIEDHENDREAIRFAIETTSNPVVKRYEGSVLPNVDKYLELAESTLNLVTADQP